LRTVFASVDGAPVQIILPSLTLQVPLLDLRQIASGEEKQFEVDRISRAEAQRPFDLARGPLLRIMLLRLADDEYQLLRAMHHIVSDGWSGRILLRELAQCYQAFSTGQLSRLEDLPIQYATYAVWQRRKFKGAVLGAQVTYWKKQLENASTIELPTSRQRPAVPTSHGARHYFVLAETLSTGLKSLSRQRGVTLFTTLLAAFQTLLHRYSGQTDIVIGSPVGGRSRSEFEGLIGFFLNMLVLRTDLSGNPSFRELLSRVRQVCFGALAHQDLPFEKLVEKLQPERNLDRNPLFQVTFGFQNTPSFPLQLPGHKIDELEVHTGIARFDLHLFMEEEGQTLRGYFDYNAELFDADVIKQLIAHFGVLLEGIVVDPDRRLSELTILTEPERHQLLVEWNNTAKDYPRDMCLQELFEEQAEKSPDGIALMFEEQQLTYRELNQRANQLAHYLRGLGVGPERLVGICVERSLEMVIGLLGILKAGGAYVPLDPSYPKEWLKFMLEDTHASIILTDRVWLSSLPPTSARIVCLDRDREEINNEPRDNPDSESTADSLAYVIYTSGSTGVPKGVNVRHRGVVRLLLGVDYVQLNRAQTFLHLAPICFDAATFELWGALLHGGKCVLFPGRVPSPRELGAVLKKHRVTTLWLTAALFNTVINEEPQALSVVKQLLIGGEALSVPHVRKGLALLPNTEIINGYGPTENTTFTCCYPIPRQLDDNLSSIPVGKPIGNTQVYILDPYLKPVPVGVAGELHIGGDGLARGYLNRLDLTAEKFIPNPFGAAPTSRLYKTGDRARYLPGGNIEFLGRIDNQVKIRGYRIELGEIETVLTQRSEVRESVVIAREDSAGDKQLVAYIVPQKSASVTRELRTYLKDKLPGYMVPSAFVVLESFPLTPNGKVDRKALPSPDRNSADSAQVYVAPRNDVDEIIAGIWAEILGIRQIGVHDNFFDLGGHSLKATQVVSRLRRAFHSEIPLRHLFEFPTVAELAVAIRASEKQRVANPKDIDRLLTEIEAISEEKAQTLLAGKRALSASGHKHD
jgi:amino acid adenylation domain-containing protein